MPKKKQERRTVESKAVARLREILAGEWTGAGMARELGCTRSMLCCLSTGKSLPSLRMAVEIERRYGIPPADWMA